MGFTVVAVTDRATGAWLVRVTDGNYVVDMTHRTVKFVPTHPNLDWVAKTVASGGRPATLAVLLECRVGQRLVLGELDGQGQVVILRGAEVERITALPGTMDAPPVIEGPF